MKDWRWRQGVGYVKLLAEQGVEGRRCEVFVTDEEPRRYVVDFKESGRVEHQEYESEVDMELAVKRWFSRVAEPPMSSGA